MNVKLIPILLLSLLFPSMLHAAYNHEFGTIAEDGGVVEHTFTIPPAATSRSILNVFPGCPCVSADYPKRPVKAGEPIKILLRYDPERQNGHFTKSVYIRYSDNSRDTLVVTGTVKRLRPRVDKNKYRHEFGMGLSLDRPAIDFGTMKPGTSRTLTIPMANSYQIVICMDLRPEGKDASLLSIPFGLKLQPETVSEFKVRVEVPDTATNRTATLWLRPEINGFDVDSIPVRLRIR